MFDKTKLQINNIADKNNFNRNITEKVLRLYSILEFLNSGDLKNTLVLKGGTAINLFLLDLPRLSVDIDVDFNIPCSKEEMTEKRKYIDRVIRNYMQDNGYHLSDKSKFHHSLDSYVFSYSTMSGSNDVLKIEINYSNRVHILPPIFSHSTPKLDVLTTVLRLADEELIGSKLSALLQRTTPRDIYDVYEFFKTQKDVNYNLLRKISIFYVCLSEELPIDFHSILNEAINKIKNLSFHKVKETLMPLLHKQVDFNIESLTNEVVSIINKIYELDENDVKFIEFFNKKQFSPEILFKGNEYNPIKTHPMAMWKIM